MTKEIAPGVYPGIPNASYHGGPGISKSGLDLVARSPAHYRAAQDAERREPTPDQRIGTLAHALILEPESFDEHYAEPFVAPPKTLETVDQIKARLAELGEKVSGTKAALSDRLRTADPSAVLLDDARAAHAEAVGDREVVSADELARARAMREAVMSHPKAAALLEPGSGVAELSCYWRDQDTDALCRCRPDWWRHDGVIVDLKTARDASPAGFPKSLNDWRYHVQAAFYLDGIAAAREQSNAPVYMPEPRAFVFVAVEKTPPYAVGVYYIDAEAVAIGRREYRADLDRYAECQGANEWPAYSDRIEPVSLPEWRLRREEIESETDTQGVFVA